MTEEKVKPQIVDVIIHGNYDQVSIVLDRMPEFIYERKPYSNLFGQDGDFVDAYGYETPSDNWKAFGGRKFEIPLTDGTVLQANGQWWSISPSQFVDEEVVSVGYCTLERLEECYVFFGGHIKKSALDEWLANNEPSNDYHKYKKQELPEPPKVYTHNGVTEQMVADAFEKVDSSPDVIQVFPHVLRLFFGGVTVLFYGPTVRTESIGIETSMGWHDWQLMTGKALIERGIDPDWWRVLTPAIQEVIDAMQIPETV